MNQTVHFSIEGEILVQSQNPIILFTREEKVVLPFR